MKKIYLLLIAFLYAINLNAQDCWKAIAAGSQHTLAVKTDGTLWAWGWNSQGELGNGTTTSAIDPIQIGTASNWDKVTAGDTFSLAIKTDGTLWAWGDNSVGQLGLGNTTDVLVPTQVGTATWTEVEAGITKHVIGLRTNGTLWGWGHNFNGQLGVGDNLNKVSPSQIGSLTTWASLTAGNGFSLAIRTNGTLWAWGHNNVGQLGIGSTTSYDTPQQVGTGTDWEMVSAGQEHTMGIRGGLLYVWGSDVNGNMGNGTSTASYSSPHLVNFDLDWAFISAGIGCHALKDDGSYWAWGNNSEGQLGLGNWNLNILSPTTGGGSTMTLVSAKFLHTIILRTDGEMRSCGNNDHYQLAINPDFSPNFFGFGPACPQSVINVIVADDETFTVINCSSISLAQSVLTGDTFNGVQATTTNTDMALVSPPSGVTMNGGGNLTIDGSVPPGTYTITYNLCDAANSSNCDQGTITLIIKARIEAVNDTYTVNSGVTTTPLISLLDNDTYDCIDATPGNTNMSLQSGVIGISLDTNTGLITVDAGMTPGTYTLTYSLCDTTLNTTNCDTATVTVTVLPPVIIANDDTGAAYTGTTTTAVTNVLADDTIGSAAATTANVTITLVGTVPSGIQLNTSTGAVTVGPAVTAGTYTITYQICDVITPSNCDTATVTITVLNTVIAVNDTFEAEQGEFSMFNVLTEGNDDTIGGSTATTGSVTISVIGSFPSNGPSFDTATGTVFISPSTPAGTYTFTYQICDNTVLSNCDSATVTITVGGATLVPGPRANNRVEFTGIQSATQKIIIAGTFSAYNNQSKNKIARINPNFAIDNSFVSTGPVSPSYLFDMQMDSNDYVIVAGDFAGFNGVNSPDGIVRLKSDGSLDQAFNPGGAGAGGSACNCQSPKVFSVAREYNGKIIAAGNFKTYNGTPRNYIVGLTSTGTIDPAFNYVSGLDAPPQMVAVQQNRVLVTGFFTRYNNISVKTLFRINEFGAIDNTFQQKVITYYPTDYPNLGGIMGQIEAIAIQPDNSIIIGGAFTGYDGVPRRNIARLDPNGNLDLTFDPGTGFDGVVKTISVEPDGTIFVGGLFSTYDGQSVNTIVRLESDGDLDTSFISGTGPSGGVYTLRRQPTDGKVIVGGKFVTYDGIYAGNVTRIVPATGVQARGTEAWGIDPAIDILSQNNNDITLYPNPSTGIFNLGFEGDPNEKFEIAVYNSLGQLLHQGTASPETANQIDLSRFENGNYYIRLQNEQRTINKVVVKK